MNLPIAFQEQMRNILGDSYPNFVENLSKAPKTSIRYNPAKQLNQQENYDGVKWNKAGVFLTQRPIFTLDPSFHAGAYYVQEASSMFLGEAMKQCVDLNQDLKVLDLCAAPGGKSTLLASIISKGSLLLANEVIRSRYNILKYNLIKWGYSNAHSSMHDSKDFTALSDFFDVVVVDAPCSGEGLFRKDQKAMEEWSLNNVQLCSGRQKRILSNAVQCLKPGGILIYCTCTYNDAENMGNARWLQEEFGLAHAPLEVPDDWGISKKEFGYQFYPHLTEGEGFYISCFKQKGKDEKPITKHKDKRKTTFKWLSKKEIELIKPWVENPELFTFYQDKNGAVFALLKSQEEAISQLKHQLRFLRAGIELGSLKNKLFLPSPSLALWPEANPSLPYLELSKEQALRYLKKETFPVENLPSGWALVKYQDLNLGWIKGIKNRFNNYYPKEWRIRMDI